MAGLGKIERARSREAQAIGKRYRTNPNMSTYRGRKRDVSRRYAGLHAGSPSGDSPIDPSKLRPGADPRTGEGFLRDGQLVHLRAPDSGETREVNRQIAGDRKRQALKRSVRFNGQEPAAPLEIPAAPDPHVSARPVPVEREYRIPTASDLREAIERVERRKR